MEFTDPSSWLEQHMEVQLCQSQLVDLVKLRCVCNEEVPSSSEALLEHYSQRHVGLWPYVCDICSERFDVRGQLREHVKLHVSHAPYECQECGVVLINQFALSSHTDCLRRSNTVTYSEKPSIRVSENRPFACELCDMTFATKRLGQIHLKSHEESNCDENVMLFQKTQSKKLPSVLKRFYKCKECGKKLGKDRSISDHICSRKEGKHCCPECGMYFQASWLLHVHMEEHDNRKSFVCTYCNQVFMSSYKLKFHMQNHTSKGVFKCFACTLFFPSSDELYAHMLNHAAEKIFECSECQICFKTQDKLNKHMRTHSQKKTCSECKKVFKNKHSLHFHKSTYHSNLVYKCNVCDRTFKRKTGYRAHVNTIHLNVRRPYKCSVCSKVFVTSSLLKKHSTIHKNTTYHDENVIVCSVCGKQFSDKFKFTKHLLKHVSKNMKS